MTVTVELFAGAREAAGTAALDVELPDVACVAELRKCLLTRAPALARFGPRLWIAVNGQYAADADVLPQHAAVACFPPVSGG